MGAGLTEKVKNKPLFPSEDLPKEGWEIVEIKKYVPSHSEQKVETTKGSFLVSLKAIPSMVAINLNYRNELNEPAYFVSWNSIISWKPIVKGE